MAGNKVDFGKLLSLEEVNKMLASIQDSLKTINVQMDTAMQTGKKIKSSFDSKSANDQIKSTKDLEKINQELIKTQKLKIQNEKALLQLEEAKKTANDKEIARLKRIENEQKKLTKEKERAAIATKKLTDAAAKEEKKQAQLSRAYVKLTRETLEAQKNFKDLATEFGVNSKEAAKARKEFERLDDKLSKVNKASRDGRKDVGRYEKALGGIKAGALALTAGLATLAIAGFQKLKQFVGDSIKTYTDFVAISAKVLAISGANMKEFASLSKLFKELGATTRFSASEVAELALELSKLGFSTKDIKASTGAILNLSAATGEDLADSAKVAASTIKQFQKDTSETGEVVDVMAKAFSSSALDLEKFQTSMAIVGPAANAVNVSLEETTAVLGKVIDSGVDASSAGSALRNVYIDLADKGLTWEDAMTKINSSQNKLSTANELFGKRGAVVATIIANNTTETAKLTKQLENSAGAAKRMADIMSNNLEGDLKAAQSATEALQIALGERFNDALRSVTQGWTEMVRSIKEFIQIDPADQLRKEKDELNLLVHSIASTNENQELRNQLIDELQTKYPSFLKNLDTENLTNEQLFETLGQVNKQYEKRIKLSIVQDEIAKKESALRDIYESQRNIVKDINKGYLEQLPTAQENISLEEKINKLKAEGLDVIRKTNDAGTFSSSQVTDLGGKYEQYLELQKEAEEQLNKIAGLTKEQVVLNDAANEVGEMEKRIMAIDAAKKAEEELAKAKADAINKVKASPSGDPQKAADEEAKAIADRLARQRAANLELIRLSNERGLKEIQNIRTQTEEEIKIELEARKILLQNDDLLYSERLVIVEKSNNRIAQLEENLNTRLKDAREALSDFYDQADLKEITNAEERVKKLIEIEGKKTEKLLANESLLAEERELILQQSIENIQAIRDEYEPESILEAFGLSREKLDTSIGLAEEATDLFFSFQNSLIDAEISRLDEEKSISEERISSKEAELSELQAIDLENIKSGDLSAKSKIRNAKAEIEAEKAKLKNIEILRAAEAKKKKKAAIAEASIDYASELIQIALYAAQQPANAITAGGFGVGVLAVQGALATARYLANLATIQNAKFADGGYTGNGFSHRDETGQRVAGIVHEKEFVINKHDTKKNFQYLQYANNGGDLNDLFSIPIIPLTSDTMTPENELQYIYLKNQIDELKTQSYYLKKIVEKPERIGSKLIKSNGTVIHKK